MSTSDLQVTQILDPASVYRQTYIRPSGTLSKNVVKITGNPSAQTISTTSSPQPTTIQLPTSQRMMAGPMIIEIDASCTSNGTYTRFNNLLGGIVQQAILTIGGVQVSNVLYASRAYVAETYANRDIIFIQTTGANGFGFGSSVTRNTWGSGQRYALEFDFGGLLNIPFPSHLLSSQLQLQIYWGPAVNVLETDGSVYGYTLSNTQCVLNYLNEDQAALDRVTALCKSQGSIALPYQWMDVQSDVVTSNTSSFSINIQTKKKSLNRLLMFYSVQANEVLPTVNGRYETFPLSSTTSYQFQANSFLVPQAPVQNTVNGTFVEGYNQLLYAFENLGTITSGPLFLGSDYAVDKFLPAYRFSSPLASAATDYSIPLLGSGLNTAQSSSQLTVNVQKGAVATIYNFYTVSWADALLIINADGSVQVLM